MKKVRQRNDRKVFSYMKFRFVSKVCKLESQAMSSEWKLLEKIQNKKAHSVNSPMNQRDLEV